jgi:hypothetical protein
MNIGAGTLTGERISTRNRPCVISSARLGCGAISRGMWGANREIRNACAIRERKRAPYSWATFISPTRPQRGEAQEAGWLQCRTRA